MIFKMLEAFFDAVAKGFSCAEVKTEKQCETNIIKSSKKIEKRSDKQEDLILDMADLIERYKHLMKKSDRIRANVYIRRIRGVN